jgi:drug/metabolite transporter (DMT)-like permease
MFKKTAYSTAIGWFILIGIGMTWGSSYLFIKKALVQFHFIEVASLRLLITAICFTPWLIRSIYRIKKSEILPVLIVAICGSGAPGILFPLAQTKLSSGYTGILSSTTPLFTLIVGTLFFSLKLQMRKVLGIAIGFLGVLLLIYFTQSEFITGSLFSALMICLATFLYSISSNTVNKYLQNLDTLSISSIAFSVLAIPSLMWLLSQGTFNKIITQEAILPSLLPILALSFFGTFLATILFFLLIKKEGVVFSSTVSYIIPCMALILAYIDGELISIYHLLGMFIILIGIYLTRNKI